MPRELKVYGTTLWFQGHKQCRAVVATYTKSRAAQLFLMSMHTFRQHAAETGNKDELEQALAKPETVIVSRDL
jgi:hypothetical protein